MTAKWPKELADSRVIARTGSEYSLLVLFRMLTEARKYSAGRYVQDLWGAQWEEEAQAQRPRPASNRRPPALRVVRAAPPGRKGKP